MAAKPVEVNVNGVTELITGSKRLVKQIDDNARHRFLTVADHAAGIVSTKVPHKTGRLASSITIEPTNRSALLRMGQGVPYAGWIEFGGTRGRPMVKQGRYVYPTALSTQDTAVAAARYAADESIEGFAWPRAQ
jgi:phage gpG-like protein